MGVNPLGLPAAGPSMFETGTGLARKGPAVLHGTEMVVGSKDREDALNSYSEAVQKQTDMLVSSAISLGNATGFGPEVNSEIKKLGVKYTFVRMPVDTDIGNARVAKGPDVIPAVRLFDLQTREEKEEKEKPETEDGSEENPSTTPITTNPEPLTTASSVMVDETGESGADFTPAGSNNRVIYDGKIVEIGHQYNPNVMGGDDRQGAGYGTYVVVRSSHPDYGEFDGLYAHFPGKDSIVVKVGDEVERGDILGPMATTAQYADPKTRPIVGSGTGPHTSLDFLKVGSSEAHPNWRQLTSGIDPNFKTEPSEGEGGSGHRAKAFHELAKDEALSSLTPGVNDYVKPGGLSVISNTPWDTNTDDTH